MTVNHTNELAESTRLREAGQTQQAAALLARVRKESNDPVETAFLALMEANCLILAGDLRRARPLLDEAERLAGKDREVRFGIEHETARLEGAEAKPALALRRTLRILQEFKDVLSGPDYKTRLDELNAERAMLLAEMGQYEAAMPHLLASHATDPDRADVTYYLGEACFRIGRLEDAISHLTQALKQSDLPPVLRSRAQYFIAYSNYKIGAYAQAISWLQKLETDGLDAEVPKESVYEMFADSFAKLGMHAEADRYKHLAQSCDG